MGLIYKIEIAGEVYIGSTKQKKLTMRQSEHNYAMRTIGKRDYNIYLYKFCREHNVEKIICELIEEVEDTELVLLEQEYISMIEPSLNSQRAYNTNEYNKEYNKQLIKKKSNCPECGKLMLKKHINRHIRNIHK